jgi:hypothetical protein
MRIACVLSIHLSSGASVSVTIAVIQVFLIFTFVLVLFFVLFCIDATSRQFTEMEEYLRAWHFSWHTVAEKGNDTGKVVVLHGLENKVYNGRQGVLGERVPGQNGEERYQVTLPVIGSQETETKTFKPQHVFVKF